MTLTDRRALALLAAVTVFSALPFLNRPYFVDDYYFVTMARGLLDHPTRPYDFRSDDAGRQNLAWERGQAPRMVNPPLFHYYLALVMKGIGESEWILRASLLPFSFVALGCMYFLGRRFVQEPLWPTLLFAVTPAFWVTSYSLLIDSMLIAFVLGGFLLFVKACETRRAALAVMSGVVLGLAMGVKYFGAIGLALAFLWLVLDSERRRWRAGYAFVLAGLAVQGIWAVWNVMTYGEPHLSATFRRGLGSGGHFFADKLLIVASFFGGASFFVVMGYVWLAFRSRWALAILLTVLSVMIALLQSSLGGFSMAQSLQFAAWAGASAAFVISVMMWARQERSAAATFLLVWLALAGLELIVVMPWTAARYLLCALPPACWLAARLLEDDTLKFWRWGLLGLTACMGAWVASADYAQAVTLRKLAHTLREEQIPHPGPRFYLGDTFSGYAPYLGPLGWQPAFPNQSFKAGDLVLVARYRTSSWWRLPATTVLEPVTAYEYHSPLLVRVMDVQASAGWYASVWGALPFVFTRHPLERFEVYRVRRS